MSPPLRQIICSTIGAVVVLALTVSAAQAQGRVVGQVTDEQGNPLAGVQITATNPAGNPSQFSTLTEDDGRFAILGLSSGQWMFRADCTGACGESNGSSRGYAPQEGPSNITQTRNQPVDFALPRILHPLAQMLGPDAVAGVDLDAVDADIESADAAFNSGRYAESITGYEAVLGRLPALGNLHFNIGNAYSQMQDHEAAIAAFERAVAADPMNQDLQVARARARLANGTADAADRQLLEQAASSLTASREDLYNQGEQAFGRGDTDGAAQWYERANMVDPNWGKPLFKLALVALNKGDIPTAKEYFQRVVDVDDPTSATETAQAQATLNALP